MSAFKKVVTLCVVALGVVGMTACSSHQYTDGHASKASDDYIGGKFASK